jgi:hypothetical protein
VALALLVLLSIAGFVVGAALSWRRSRRLLERRIADELRERFTASLLEQIDRRRVEPPAREHP